MACPEELGGIYAEEEMARDVTSVDKEKTKELTAQIQPQKRRRNSKRLGTLLINLLKEIQKDLETTP